MRLSKCFSALARSALSDLRLLFDSRYQIPLGFGIRISEFEIISYTIAQQGSVVCPGRPREAKIRRQLWHAHPWRWLSCVALWIINFAIVPIPKEAVLLCCLLFLQFVVEARLLCRISTICYQDDELYLQGWTYDHAQVRSIDRKIGEFERHTQEDTRFYKRSIPIFGKFHESPVLHIADVVDTPGNNHSLELEVYRPFATSRRYSWDGWWGLCWLMKWPS